MLKCYVRGDPPAVFPKKRSVLLLAAVVLLLCCCLFVPAAAANDVTVDPVVFGTSYWESYWSLDYGSDGYLVTLAYSLYDLEHFFSYNIGVNVTSSLVEDGEITFEWWDHHDDKWYPNNITSSASDTIHGNTVTSTINLEGSKGDRREPPLYYEVIIKAKDSSGSIVWQDTKKFYVGLGTLIKPMDLAIYANDTFPKPRYECYDHFYTWNPFYFVVDGKEFIGEDLEHLPFTINYYNITTGTPVHSPVEPGIYKSVIEPTESDIDLSKITVQAGKGDTSNILFQDGTLTVLPTTDQVKLSLSTDPSSVSPSNTDIFVFGAYSYNNLNGGNNLKSEESEDSPWYGPVYFLQDDLLDDEEALLTKYLNEYCPGYDAEMKYFDMVVDNIWVELFYDSPRVYWPYPEGTDEKTEFTLLYLDTRRSLDPVTPIVGTPVKITPFEYDDKYLYFARPSNGFSGFYALIWKDATEPVVIEPVNLTIYANEKFPLPLYSGIPKNAVIKVNGAEWNNGDYPYPFEIAYYNTTTNTQIFKPDTPGIYNATIQPASVVQLEQITIGGNPVTFRNGTLTVRQITDANETIPVAQQTRGGDGISVSVPAGTTYYLNDNTSLPVTSGDIRLLHDEILAGGEETLKRIAPGYFDDSSKYEMKYFDLIDTGNGHTWVSSSKDVTITWPYPEGTDENTEFTLLHYLDLHREYFTDADLNSDTETVTVRNIGSGVQFSIQESGFSPFALIWSDQKPVPIPPSGGGSSDGNMDNAFRVLFNDGSTTLFVVTDLSYGDKLTKPEDPVKDGYTFAGWHKDAACTQAWDFADGIAGDMTLYAKWTPVQTVTPTVTPTATVSVTPTVTAEPSGLPTTTPTVQPTGEDDGGKPAGTVLPLIGGILILILAVLLLLFLLLRHTVTFLIPTGGEITEHRIKVWHGRYIDPADLPELLRTAAWYRDPARRERWDFDEDRVTKSMELYLG